MLVTEHVRAVVVALFVIGIACWFVQDLATGLSTIGTIAGAHLR